MTLLVPIDTTDPSRAAVALAAMLASDLDPDVLLLHVSRDHPALGTLAALHELAEPFRSAGLLVRLRTTRGTVGPRVCEVARQRGCSWVFMGISHLGGSSADSIARHVMLNSPCPVVAIRPGTPIINHSTGPVAVLSRSPGTAALRIADLLSVLRRSPWQAYAPPDEGGILRPAPDTPPIGHGAVLVTAKELWPASADGPSVSWWPAFKAREPRPVVVVSAGIVVR